MDGGGLKDDGEQEHEICNGHVHHCTFRRDTSSFPTFLEKAYERSTGGDDCAYCVECLGEVATDLGVATWTAEYVSKLVEVAVDVAEAHRPGMATQKPPKERWRRYGHAIRASIPDTV